MRRVLGWLVMLLLVAGCSHAPPQPAQHPEDPELLADCGPLPDTVIAEHLNVGAVRQQTSPTICTWVTDSSEPIDITYAWLRSDTLARNVAVAHQYGYDVEKTVIRRFGAMYWRDPHDPGSCAVTAADSGTISWWVQNRSHNAVPDPCAAALDLMTATLSIDGI